jgi:nucleolar pre-ribosomal-associated protein 1
MASFGTAGTAGMGGGFGYSRGEVTGFDALSQVHVLALLRDVKEWDWARKAGKYRNLIDSVTLLTT